MEDYRKRLDSLDDVLKPMSSWTVKTVSPDQASNSITPNVSVNNSEGLLDFFFVAGLDNNFHVKTLLEKEEYTPQVT